MSTFLVRMEEDLGQDATRAFLAEWGGREFHIARYRGAGTAPEVLDWLRREIGHGKVMTPIGPAARQARIAWAVYARLCEGQSLATIAKALGLHTRTVSKRKRELSARGLLTSHKDSAR